MKRLTIVLLAVLALMFNSCSGETDFHALRQQAFAEKTQDGVALLFSSDVRGRMNKNFYYLTGVDKPDMLIVVAGGDKNVIMLFAEEPSDDAYLFSQFTEKAGQLIAESEKLYFPVDQRSRVEELAGDLLNDKVIESPDYIFYQMREIKDEFELELLTEAVNITARAYLDVIKNLRPGITEQELIDRLKELQIEFGAEETSHIQAGSGINGTEIHARASQKVVEESDLIVFDVGCWYNKYTSDISRTIPASGKFSEAQRKIYQLVLDAEKAGIELMVPGMVMKDVQNVVEGVLLEGLLDLGLITDLESPWQRRLYIVHGFYHYIGLDIHDLYNFMSRETATKTYEPGMVMTIEPGLYFPPTLLDSKPGRGDAVSDNEWEAFVAVTRDNFLKYVNNGVRIEDDILITETGNIVLSDIVPREIEDIEALMARK